jgi:tRNA A37 methylthiotransferase MiaB
MERNQKKFYVESYGCSASLSDSEIISGLLSRSGFKQVQTPEHSSLMILNTCYVKQSTENKILERLSELAKKFPEKKLIISGCMPDAITKKLKEIAPSSCLISTNRITEIERAARLLFEDKPEDMLGHSLKEKVGLIDAKKNSSPDIIQICSGCLGNCSYCGTKISKGNLVSYSPEKIALEVNHA